MAAANNSLAFRVWRDWAGEEEFQRGGGFSRKCVQRLNPPRYLTVCAVFWKELFIVMIMIMITVTMIMIMIMIVVIVRINETSNDNDDHNCDNNNNDNDHNCYNNDSNNGDEKIMMITITIMLAIIVVLKIIRRIRIIRNTKENRYFNESPGFPRKRSPKSVPLFRHSIMCAFSRKKEKRRKRKGD